MTAAEVRRYAAAFGIAVEPERELGGGFSNDSWLARSRDGDLVVRRYGRLNVTRSALFYEHAVMRHAAARTTVVRAPLAGDDGESLRLIDGAFVGLLPFIAGTTGSRAALKEAAGALARFHRAMHDFRAQRPRVTRTLGTLAWLRERFVRFAGDARVGRALDWNAAIAAVTGAAARVAPRARGLPHGVVHGDAHPDNVVTSDGFARALIDFDFTHETERAYDVATAADAFARESEAASLDVGRFVAFARAYDAALPLAADEWAVLWEMAARRSAMLVWYVVTRHGERRPGDVGRAPLYVERLRELERLGRAGIDLRAVS